MNLFSFFSGRPKFWRSHLALAIVAASLMLASRLPAQTIVLTNASLSDLQNAMAAGGTIVLAFNNTITANVPLTVSSDTVIYAPAGNSVTLSGGGTTRLFKVPLGLTLTLSNLTLSGGNNIGTNGGNGGAGASTDGGTTGNPGGNGQSGGDASGGAIYNQGITLVYSCTFLTNSATAGKAGNGGNGGSGSFSAGNGGNGGNGGNAFGGAIYNAGALVLTNCTLSGNGAIGANGGTGGTNGSGSFANPGNGGAGGLGSGGAIYNVGFASVSACTFNLNFSFGGNSESAGAINGNNAQNGSAGAVGRGGAIFNADGGTYETTNCTISGNLAEGGAGGNGANNPGSFNGGNGGNGGNALGGGFFNDAGGSVSILNCTFADSTCTGGTNGVGGTGGFGSGANGNIGRAFGANVYNNGGTFNLANSLLAYPTNAPNAGGTITDFDHNISSDASAAFTQGNSFNNVDPLLAPLSNNGGPTQTMALQAGSPAIDAITDGSAPPTDQRGAPRPIGAGSDIGAYEFGALFTITGQVKSAAGAVSTATIVATGPFTITAHTDASGNYTLTNVPKGTYTLTPQDGAFTFTPSNVVVTIPGQTNAVNFTEIHPSFFNGEISLNNGVYYLAFVNSTTNNSTNVVTTTNTFGYYSYVSFPLFFHFDLGYEYFFDANDGHGDAYFYDFASQHFFYTGPKLWPYIYDFTLNDWLYYFEDPNIEGRYQNNSRPFYNFGTGQFISQ